MFGADKCKQCPNPTRPGKMKCQECADKVTRYLKEKREERIAKKQCVTCPVTSIQPARPGLQHCQDCADRQAASAKSRKETRKKLNVCTMCGKRPRDKGLLCVVCHPLYRQQDVARRDKRKASGRCQNCGSHKRPVVPGTTQCAVCLKKKTDGVLKEKAMAMARYGLACKCCGEDRPEFLTLDHVRGDGAAHRRKLKKLYGWEGGASFYRHLRKNGYPEGYQTLCWNCNAAKSLFGGCPHQRVNPVTNQAGGQSSPG